MEYLSSVSRPLNSPTTPLSLKIQPDPSGLGLFDPPCIASSSSTGKWSSGFAVVGLGVVVVVVVVLVVIVVVVVVVVVGFLVVVVVDVLGAGGGLLCPPF